MIKTLAPEIITFLISMLPVGELRAAIPFGIAVLKMDPWSAFAFAITGNVFISIVVLFLLDPVTIFLRKKSKLMNRFFDWLFNRTRTKHNKLMSEIGHIALLIFVAIPMPGSGGWTGALIAYLFGVKTKASIPLISMGIVISGVFVTFGTDVIISLFR